MTSKHTSHPLRDILSCVPLWRHGHVGPALPVTLILVKHTQYSPVWTTDIFTFWFHGYSVTKLKTLQSWRLLQGLIKQREIEFSCDISTGQYQSSSGKPDCHITPLLVDLHWLPVKFRIEFKIPLIVFKIFKGLAPSYLSFFNYS